MLCDAYLSGEPECWEPHLSGSFSFVGPLADSACTGLDAFRARCKAYVHELMPLRLYCDAPQIVYATNRVVALFVTASPESPEQTQPYLRITIVWHIQDDQAPKLIHMHASFSYRSLVAYSQMRSADGGDAAVPKPALAGGVLVRDFDGVSRFINSGEVVYLEAAHQYVLFHTLFGTYKVRRTLSIALKEMGGMLVRVHRSFAVNASMVQSVSAGGVRMVTGDVVPIPAKRLPAVREDICRMRGMRSLRECPPPRRFSDLQTTAKPQQTRSGAARLRARRRYTQRLPASP